MTPPAVLTALLAVNLSTGTVPEISLRIDGCPSLPRDEIVRLAGLELDAHITSPPAAGLHATSVAVVCAGPEVQLAVSDPLTRKQLLRTMALAADTEKVAARLVALAISELVITSWMELTLSSVPTPSEGSGQPPAELRQAAQERAERRAPTPARLGYVLIVGQAAGPFSGVGVGWGGGFRLGWAAARPRDQNGAAVPTTHLGADLDLTGGWADIALASGTIRLSTWSAAPRASLKLRRGRGWLDVGAGGRFGLARLVGTPSDPASTRGFTHAGTWAGPIAYVGVGALFGKLAMTAGVEGGHVLRTVTGREDGGTGASVAGNWLAASVAVGWGQ